MGADKRLFRGFTPELLRKAFLDSKKKHLILAGVGGKDDFLQEISGIPSSLPHGTGIVGEDSKPEDVFAVNPYDPFRRAGCVIMASGLGTRFGGNKLMADFWGEPVIAGCLGATEFLPNRVVVTRNEAVAAYCREREIPVVLHTLPFRSDTVRLGVEALRDVDCCIFCQGDQPLLRQETLAIMALRGIQRNAPILRASFGERIGSPTAFPSRYFDALRHLPEGKGGNVLVKKYPDQVQTVQVQSEYELFDIDTPEALEILKGIALKRDQADFLRCDD